MTSIPQSRDSWIAAAFRALTRGGPQAIRAEAIARDLGVSKGSFYWHFQNLPDLRQQMLAHWQGAATQAVIARIETDGGDAMSRLARLMDIAAGDDDAKYGGAGAEAAIRDWARYDDKARAAVTATDRLRLEYLVRLFIEGGLDEGAARRAARLIYASYVGLDRLGADYRPTASEDLGALARALLTGAAGAPEDAPGN